jgi:predicted outer membrane protein
MHGLKTITVIAAFALTTGLSPAPTPPNPQTGTVEFMDFFEAALAHAQSQLALAELAEQKSKTPSIDAYARRIATQRAALIDQLNAAAKAAGIDTEADSGHAPVTDTFKPLRGEAFDRAYIAAEQEDQENARDEYQFAADHLTDADLQKLATDEVAELQQDITDGRTIAFNLPFSSTESTDASSLVINPRQRQ